jgi:hypothetical protein
MNWPPLLLTLFGGLAALDWGQVVMLLAGGLLILLAVVKQYEPVLLLPIGFGCLLANIPLAGLSGGEGFLGVLYDAGVRTELFPLLIFVGVGAMIDFSPLLSQRPGSSASSAPCCWPRCWASRSTKPPPSGSSAPSMVPPPSLWPRSLRPGSWRRLP